MQNRILDTSEVEWNASRPDVASGVSGYRLIPEGFIAHSISLTMVEPGGRFSPHKDDYHHVFYFIDGNGTGTLDDKMFKIRPGLIVQVSSGTLHSYENTGASEMTLLTINFR